MKWRLRVRNKMIVVGGHLVHTNMVRMRIVSLNVQGVDGPLCKRMKGRLKPLMGGLVDNLLIQEHHLHQ